MTQGEQLPPTDEKLGILLGQVLTTMVKEHADRLGLDVLDFDPTKYPQQAIDTIVWPGKTLPVAETDEYLKPRFPAYLDLRELLRQDEAITALVDEIIFYLDAHKNIVVAVPHYTILDLVYATLLISDLVALQKGTPELRSPTILTLSKAIPMLAEKKSDETPEPETVVQMLGRFNTKLFFTLPDTDNANTALSPLPDDYITTFRARFNRAVVQSLRHGGNIIGLAPTGTTDNKEIEIVRGSEGILTHRNSIVVPVRFDFDPVNAVIGNPKKYSTAEEVKKVLYSL